MHKWQILTSIFVLLFVCGEVTAGDKEDVVATVDAIKAAWTAADVDAAQNTMERLDRPLNPLQKEVSLWQ